MWELKSMSPQPATSRFSNIRGIPFELPAVGAFSPSRVTAPSY